MKRTPPTRHNGNGARRTEGPDDYAAPASQRLLPSNREAEVGLICSALIDPLNVIDDAAQLVAPEAFHAPPHGLIWEQLVTMQAERVPVDLVTLIARMRDRGLLEQVGGAAALSEHFTYLPTAVNWHYYAEIVREKAVLRALISACSQIERRAYEEPAEVREIVEDAVTRMVEIAAGSTAENAVLHVAKFAAAAFSEIQMAYDNRGRTIGLPTGFVDLDRMIGGWQRGFTYYFGGRPAMGKSSLGLNLGFEVAAQALAEGAPVLIFSLEMTGVQLTKRLILTLSEINQQRARDGFLAEGDMDGLFKAANKVAAARLFIDETAALTIAQMRARVRRWAKQMRRKYGDRDTGKPDGLVIIDYLQRMKGSSKRSEDARYLELQEIAQGISQTAKELHLPFIVLAQLKRPKDKRPDTEPDMSEFRECGDIEQEAHVVGLLHRPHYYVKHNADKQQALAEELCERFKREAMWKGMPKDQADAEIRFGTEDLARYAKLIIDKQREGPVGPVDLRFIADYTKFETWDKTRKRYSNNAEERQAPAEGEEA